MKMRLPMSAAVVIAAFHLGAAMVPDGFYYERNDHIQTGREPLFFTYSFAQEDSAALKKGVEFEVSDLARRTVFSGRSDRCRIDGRLAVFRLLEPDRMAKLATGWYDLAIRPVGESEYFHLKFYVRQFGAAAKPVVYLLDNATPEGFALWANGDSPDIEPLRAFPESGSPALVVVSSYTPLPADQLAELKKFVSEGGTAVFFGVNNGNLDELNPLVLRRSALYSREPVAVSGGPFDGKTFFPVNAVLASGAKAIAVTENGAPAIAEKTFGRGKVIAFAGAIKPNVFYDELVFGTLGLTPAAHGKAPQKSSSDGYREGISRDNFGRFGWLNDDRVNAVGIRPEQRFRMWDVVQDYFGVSFTDTNAPGTLAAERVNWIGKSLIGRGGRWGEESRITFGLGTPGVLFENSSSDTVRIESPMLGFVAWPTAQGSRTAELGRDGELQLAGLERNWLLVWNRKENYDAWPLLISFNRRLKAAKMVGGELVLEFARPDLAISIMPLCGLRHFTPEEVAAWVPELPRDVLKKADFWNRALAARTVGCVEEYKVDREAGKVSIRNTFDYHTIRNDWGVEPEPVAPLPPLLAVYAKTGFVEFGEGCGDLAYATFYGPLRGRRGSGVAEYTLALPQLDYTLPTRAVDPRLDLPVNKALFDRIIEHLAVPDLIYIGSNFSLVEPVRGRIYPNRDLQDTVTRSTTEAPEWKYIDLHRSLGGVTGNLMFKPYLDGVGGYEEAKARLETKINRNIQRDIEYFQYKMFLLYRNEPFSGIPYLMAFLGPVRLNDGYRIFHDMNETAGIFLETMGLYSRMYGDLPFFRSNLPFIELFNSNVRSANDWSWMSSMAVEWGMGNNIDMLNAELTGWAGSCTVNTALGREEEADFARYMAAKAAVSTGARLFLQEFYNSLNFPIPPELGPVIHEMADIAQDAQIRNRYLPLGVSQGYGEGWPSLWPNAINEGLLSHFIDGKDFYSTSKGVPVELLNFYRSSPEMTKLLLNYEEQFRTFAFRKGRPYLYSRTAGRFYLDPENRKGISDTLFRTFVMPGCTAKILGAGLADWELTGMTIVLELLRQTADQDRTGDFVPVADEKNGRISWDIVDPKKGQPRPKYRQIRVDQEPENVADGAVAACFELAAPADGNQPVVFTRFDKKAVRDKNCTALSFLIKSQTPGTLDVVLPNVEWNKRLAVPVKLGEGTREWTRIRLEFERDFKMSENGMTPADLRGELFFFNGVIPGQERAPITWYIDDIRFEP